MSGRIERIEAFDLVIPLPQPLKLAAMLITQREYIMVRVWDEDGLYGTSIGLTRSSPIAATVLRTVAPHLTGGDLADYWDAYNRVIAANVCLGTNGMFWRALSLVDCAVYDLMARRENQPLYKFLQGTPRAINCVLVDGYPLSQESPDSLASLMHKLSAMQPAGIKIGSCGNPEGDTRRLAACRKAMPSGPPLMIDLYWQINSAREFLAYAADWDQFGMGWIEDPVAFDDYAAAALLSEGLDYPVAIGDEQSGLRTFTHIMDYAEPDIIRLDATVCGGITAFLAIASAAAARNIPVACHIFPELHVQLASVAENVRWVEMFLPDSGLDAMHLISGHQPVMTNGCLAPSDQFGLGFDWDEKAIERYRVTRGVHDCN